MSARWVRRTPLSAALAVLACLSAPAAPPDRAAPANHEGRTLPALPKFTAPILFNTPEADAVLGSMQIFPKDNPWNEDVTKLPVHKDSEKMIAQIGKDKKLAYNLDMGFIL